jgi:hypothetical protein
MNGGVGGGKVRILEKDSFLQALLPEFEKVLASKWCRHRRVFAECM